MPELPEVQALSDALGDRLTGLRLATLDFAAFSALKTVTPAADDLLSLRVVGAGRRGKFVLLDFPGPLFLVVHLARAGWLRLQEGAPVGGLRRGRGPLVVRAVFVDDDGQPAASLDITEAGTRKGVAVYVVADPLDVPGIAALGPDALDVSVADLAAVLAQAGGTRLKNALRDQRLLAGIGNAYSDEILFRARISPYAPASGSSAEEVARLQQAMTEVLGEASARAAQANPTAMKAEKKAGLQVHGRTGQSCPVCGTTIAEVSLADSSFQYCPGCQTDGKVLSDRRMSRLLK